MKIVDNKAIFDSGREANCNNGFIGINNKFELSEGYDGNFHILDEEYENEDLSDSEKVELANYMINQWTMYRIIAENGLESLIK